MTLISKRTEKTSSSHAFLKHGNVSCMTREEECLLKTALAMVVVRKRKATSNAEESDSADKSKKRKLHSNLLDRILQSQSSSSSSASPLPLLQLPHPLHMDRIFQAARSMSTITSRNHKTKALQGTTNHLANQLQVWIERINDDPSSKTTKVEQWIRSSLMAMPMESTYAVYDTMIDQGTSSFLFLETVFKVLIHLIHDLYQDQLWAPPIDLSRQLEATKDEMRPKHTTADVLGVAWLRLAQKCMTTCLSRYETMLQILHDALGDLLVPLPCTTTDGASSSLAKTFWELCTKSPPKRNSSSSRYKKNPNYQRLLLDPGAKVLLRLGLYRLLYLQPLSGVRQHEPCDDY